MSQELKFRPDGRVLAVAYVDGGVGLWDVAEGTPLRDGPTGSQEVYTLDWSPAGDVLVFPGGHLNFPHPWTSKFLQAGRSHC